MDNHFVLFDLDGTITDSSRGIINSIQFALNELGIQEHDQQKLRSFVGPSLQHTFQTHYLPEGDDYKIGVAHYRTYYAEKGIYENDLYPGVPDLLEQIKSSGAKVALATAKPTYFANVVLKHFNIREYFDVVVGSHLGGTRTHKNEIIFEVLDQLGWPKSEHKFMIGDREYDLNGGKHHGLKTIGVKYGYATENEIENQNPDFIVHDVPSIWDCLK